jgi:hypothetical protein
MIIQPVTQTDHCLDTLLILDGETFVVEGASWVKFVVKKVPASPAKPHGLDYSLTLRERGQGSSMTTSTRVNA